MTEVAQRPRKRARKGADVAGDGLMTRLNLLAQRFDAEVHISHHNHRWVVAVWWEDTERFGAARAEGRSVTECLTSVLRQLSA